MNMMYVGVGIVVALLVGLLAFGTSIPVATPEPKSIYSSHMQTNTKVVYVPLNGQAADINITNAKHWDNMGFGDVAGSGVSIYCLDIVGQPGHSTSDYGANIKDVKSFTTDGNVTSYNVHINAGYKSIAVVYNLIECDINIIQ